MRLRAELVVIPCVTFTARVRLVSGIGALTPIELVALRAIGLGLEDVDSLARLVGLGTRPTLDLIYDFWLRGYVLVDTTYARVRLAGEAADFFAAGTIERLATAENNIETVPLVQELVSGAVLPHVGRTSPPGTESSLVPTVRNGFDLSGVTSAEVLDAVRQEVDRRSRKLQRDLAVQEAWVDPDQVILARSEGGEGRQQRRFLPVWADIQQNADSGRLVFDIVEAPELSIPARREIARSLSMLAEQMPEHLYFKRLRQIFERAPSLDSAITTEEALSRMARAVDGLESTDRGLVEARHDQLQQLFTDACHDIKAAVEAEADIRLVAGYSDHEVEIRRLIKSAERQLVLGNPWIRLEALVDPLPNSDRSWFDLLDDAMAGGVQVFLLWGISPDAVLDGQAATALIDLSAKHSGRLVLSRRSSTLHAKFVVRDAHEALVTSYNFLDPPQARDSLELGLVVRGLEPNTAPESVLDLLEWIRNAFPDYMAAKRMLLLPHELRANEVASAELPAAPPIPPPEVTGQLGNGPTPAIKHWADAWRATYEQLLAAKRNCVHGARLVVNREHRDALWQALRASERRIAVLSDRVSVDVVSDKFVKLLRAKLDDGVSCAFLFRREGASDQEGGPAERIRNEADRFPDLCHLIEARSHAKVLLSDDAVTIGSFNFLSYGGDYASHERERAEISFCVHDPEIANQLVLLLDVQWHDSFSHLVARRDAPEPLVLTRIPPMLQPLFLGMKGQRGPGAALLAWFGNTGSPWDDLEALEQVGLPGDDLYKAAAAALSSASDVETPLACRWRARLAMDRWRTLDFVGSALLLPEDGDAEVPLQPWLALLGAAVDGASVASPTLPASLHELSRPEATAAAALLIVEILVDGKFDLVDVLRQLEPCLYGPAAAWPRAVRSYYESTYQPLPMALLRQRAGRAQRRAESAEAKAAFGRDLESAESVGFRFPLGEHTWNRLKAEGRLLGELRLSHNSDDAERLARFLESIDRTGDTAESLMDASSYDVRDEHNQRIDEPKRGACLKRLTRAMNSARAWLALARADAPDATAARVLLACKPLRLALAGLRGDEADERNDLAGPALRHARARLAPLLGEAE